MAVFSFFSVAFSCSCSLTDTNKPLKGILYILWAIYNTCFHWEAKLPNDYMALYNLYKSERHNDSDQLES